MGGPTNEADGGNFSAVSRKCSTLLELVVLNCSDDADPTAPGKELEEPSMVLCGSVPGLDVVLQMMGATPPPPRMKHPPLAESARMQSRQQRPQVRQTWMKKGKSSISIDCREGLRDPRSRNRHEPPQKKSA